MTAAAQDAPPSGASRRVSRSDWLSAAHDLLVASGIDAVRVTALARRLGVSRTGFYWHFEDREALLEAVLGRWEERNTGNLLRRCEAYAETVTEAMFNLFDCWLDDALFDAGLDRAIRGWAHHDPKVRARIDAADTARLDAVTRLFERFGAAPAEAEVRAMTVLYTQVGYISMDIREPLATRLARMPGYAEVFTGRTPSEAEIRRFRARHVAPGAGGAASGL